MSITVQLQLDEFHLRILMAMKKKEKLHTLADAVKLAIGRQDKRRE